MNNVTVTGNAHRRCRRRGNGDDGEFDRPRQRRPGGLRRQRLRNNAMRSTASASSAKAPTTTRATARSTAIPSQVFATIANPVHRWPGLWPTMAARRRPSRFATIPSNPALDGAIGGTDSDQRGVAAFDNVAGTGDSGNNRDIGAYETAPFVSHAPIAADDAFTGAEDSDITGNVLADNGAGEDERSGRRCAQRDRRHLRDRLRAAPSPSPRTAASPIRPPPTSTAPTASTTG